MRYPPVSYSSICFRRYSDLHSRKTQWLWDGWLPAGRLVILEGDPGMGKSLVTLDLCARLTSGRPLPDGTAPPTPCNVVVLTAEDSVQETVRPRLQALSADLDRVYDLQGILDKQGEVPLRLPSHAQALYDVVRETQAKVVVLDPFVAFLDRSVATYHDQSVRAVLGLLAALAEEQRCAMVLVRHLNKSDQQRAQYRGGGSIGFTAAVRCIWLITGDPKQPGRRVLAPVKNNLRVLPTSLSFEISGTSPEDLKLAWCGESPYSCDELLERKHGRRGRPATKRERIQENLKLFLEEAPRTLDEVREFTEGQRVSDSMLDRVKKALNVRSVRAPHGDRRSTFWLLPGQLPANVTEEMLAPVETLEQQVAAAQEDMDEDMAELARKYREPIAPGGGRRRIP
jgi:hypothetical protein